MTEAFSWEVELPGKPQAQAFLGQQRPKAVLVLRRADEEPERVFVPVAVGRRLKAAKDAGELAPSSRAELLFHVKRVSLDAAHARMESLVNKRDYSRAELEQKLRQDGYSTAVTQEMAQRASDSGMVDDQRFAAFFIRSKTSAGWGRLKVERELKRRGIEPADVRGWPHEFFSDEDDFERAYALASRRRLSGKNDYEKLVRHLASKGFPLGLCTKVARRVLDEAAREE